MNSILIRANRNFFLRHPWQLVLAIIGIALGVAVVVSIDLARNSAEYAFERSTQAIAGKATHRIIGGPGGLDESIYTKLRVKQGLRLIAPVVQGYITISNENSRETLTLLGIDPFAERPFRDYWRVSSSRSNDLSGIMSSLITKPNTVLMDSTTAQRLHVGPGEQLDVSIGTQQSRIHLLQLLANDTQSTVYTLENLVLADIATAQELLGMTGRLSHIDLYIADDQSADEKIGQIKSILPDGVELLPAAARNQSVRQMTHAFHTNLTALSLLALLVGMFLIYNTMTFMVVQRRQLFGILRAVGITKQQLFRVILIEAITIGVIATLIGIVGGIGLGKILLQFVNRTINDLYFLLPVTELSLSPLTWVKGLLLGLVATVVAAILPAIEAAKVTPRQAMSRSYLETRTRRLVSQTAMAGILSMLCGGIIISVSAKSIVAGFIGIFVIILGCTLMTPVITVTLMGLLSPVLKRLFGTAGKLAAHSIVATLSRTAVAIGALMVAFATVIGIGLMIDSFRLSVDRWLETTLRADIYVSTPGPSASGSYYKLEQNLANSIRSLAEVDAVSGIRLVQIESTQGLTELAAYELTDLSWGGFRFKHKYTEDIRSAFEGRDAVIVSEPYAYHNDVQPGDTVQLRTDHKYHDFMVVGVYYNYRSDQGIVAMSRKTYDRHWSDDSYSGFGVYTKPNTDIDRLRDSIRALAPDQSLWIEDRHKILDDSMEIFDQTFAITEILRVLAAIIAFIGLFSALMALQLERTREFGIFRAIGFLPSQLWVLVVSETGLLGLVAGILAIPVGCLITTLLIMVINRRSFGWSMQLQYNPEILIQGLVLAFIAALLAGIYPALKMSQTQPAEALRSE
jgi:putative ABC transport system permease protein